MARANITEAFLTALESQVHKPIVFVELKFDSETLRVCSANRTISWNGYSWLGTGVLGSISMVKETMEQQSNSLTLSLSGVPSDSVSLALGEVYKGRAGNIYIGCIIDEQDYYLLTENGGFILQENGDRIIL